MGEPIQLSAGNIVPPPEYWPIIRQICDKYDVLIISDEVATGFGRTGEMWGADTFNTIPDILCMGKGISAGYAPMSGVAFRDEIAEVFISDDRELAFQHGHTYGGNPICSAAGIAAVQELIDQDLVSQSYEMGKLLRQRLGDLTDLGIIGDIRGKGLMAGIEFVQDVSTMEPFDYNLEFGVRVGKNCIHNQNVLVVYGPNSIILGPPFIVTEDEIDYLVNKIAVAIMEELEGIKAGL